MTPGLFHLFIRSKRKRTTHAKSHATHLEHALGLPFSKDSFRPVGDVHAIESASDFRKCPLYQRRHANNSIAQNLAASFPPPCRDLISIPIPRPSDGTQRDDESDLAAKQSVIYPSCRDVPASETEPTTCLKPRLGVVPFSEKSK
jgi:hypothetical protein